MAQTSLTVGSPQEVIGDPLTDTLPNRIRARPANWPG
jgi:hypothetical protein